MVSIAVFLGGISNGHRRDGVADPDPIDPTDLGDRLVYFTDTEYNFINDGHSIQRSGYSQKSFFKKKATHYPYELTKLLRLI